MSLVNKGVFSYTDTTAGANSSGWWGPQLPGEIRSLLECGMRGIIAPSRFPQPFSPQFLSRLTSFRSNY